MRSILTLAVLIVTGSSIRADEIDKAAIKKLATEITAAAVKEDCAKVIDGTIPTVVALMGGKEKAVEQLREMINDMKSKGFKFIDAKAGEPGEIFTEGKSTFVIVPTTFEMEFAKGRVRGSSYLLGISSDAGKTWKFADGAGLQDGNIKKVLPKLPPKMKLPEAAKPEIIPSDKK